MTRMITKITTAVAGLFVAAIALTSMSGQANATPTFNWDLFGGFVNSSIVCSGGTGTCPNADDGENDDITLPFAIGPYAAGDHAVQSKVAWNDTRFIPRQSSLEILEGLNNAGTIEADGAVEDGSTLRHENLTVNTGTSSLEHVDILEMFTLTTLGDDPVLVAFTPFFIEFFETPNFDTPCPAGDGIPCDDIFVLLNPGALTVPFTYDGTDFVLTLEIDGLSIGTIGEAEALLDRGDLGPDGAPAGFFTTEEGEITDVIIKLRLRKVPEPTTLGVLGLGLLGLAGLGRRRRNKAA